MDNELFCGLTRREMNVALMTWWVGQSPETRIAEYSWTGLYLTENGKGTQYNEGFDDDLNACAVIEVALSHEQQENYIQQLANVILGGAPAATYEYYALATANASARVRALLRTLGLRKEERLA